MATRVAALALLVALAGCGAVVDAPSPTLTPAPVPEEATVTPTPTRLPPGVGADGIEPFTLAGAHRQALRNTSYTRVRTLAVVDDEGTLTASTARLAVDRGGTPYHLVRTSTGAERYPVSSVAPRVEIWFASPPALFRIGATNVTYRRGSGTRLAGPVSDVSGHDRIAALLYGFDLEVRERVHVDGQRAYRLESARLTDPAVLDVPLFLEDPRDVSLVMLVTRSGVVRRYRLSYAATFEDHAVTVTRRVQYVRVGETDVSRPVWYDEALNATGTDGSSKEPFDPS